MLLVANLVICRRVSDAVTSLFARSEAVWGSPQGDGSSTWRVFNTADLPSPGVSDAFVRSVLAPSSDARCRWLITYSYFAGEDCKDIVFVAKPQGDGEDFNAKQIHQHSQQLLHFLKQFLGKWPHASPTGHLLDLSNALVYRAAQEMSPARRDLLALSGGASWRTVPSGEVLKPL